MNYPELRDQFQANGYAIVRGLFSPKAAAYYRDHYMALRAARRYTGDLVNQWDDGAQDPLQRYPRMFNMHHWDAVSDRFADRYIVGHV